MVGIVSLWVLLTVLGWVSFALAWNGYSTVRPLREITTWPQGSRDSGAEPLATSVTVVLSARDEEDRIEQTVTRILGQQGVRIELSAVNDRSTDQTGEILTQLEREHVNFRVCSVHRVPPGWIAKSHACRVAAAGATSDWLLFTDADTWMAPDTVARALQLASTSGAAHLVLTPYADSDSIFGRAALLYFLTQGIGIGGLVQRGIRGAYIGIGAFNLVRREVYERFGGHEAIRYELLDDIALGREVVRAGERTVVADGMELLRVSWAPGPFGLIGATEKNFFSVMNYSGTRTLLVVATLLFTAFASAGSPLLGYAILNLERFGPFADPMRRSLLFLSWAPTVSWLATWIPYAIGARRAGWSWTVALLAPLGVLTLAAALLKSAFVTLRRRGVLWRDTFYPLAELRAFRRRQRIRNADR